jgi:hypothetical protein
MVYKSAQHGRRIRILATNIRRRNVKVKGVSDEVPTGIQSDGKDRIRAIGRACARGESIAELLDYEPVTFARGEG